MFTEILKIIPRLDEKSISTMTRALQTRFTKIAKGFGRGIANVFKGGGILGAAMVLIDKILNPLKDVQEALDRTLKQSDDLATNAGQFQTETGKLFKLVQLAKATGLDEDNLYMLITKFQTAVAEAKADPSKPSSVRNFVDQPDTAQGFFEFIQSLQKMERGQQLLVQQQVFGEKQILRMADFLQTDLNKVYSQVGLDKVTAQKLTTSIEKMAGLNDLADALQAKRETEDVVAKSSVINSSMIRARDQSERLALEKENKRLASYDDLAVVSDMSTRIMGLVETGIAKLGEMIIWLEPAVKSISATLEKFSKSSSIMRGIFKFGKGD